jgi:hypothetical protein
VGVAAARRDPAPAREADNGRAPIRGMQPPARLLLLLVVLTIWVAQGQPGRREVRGRVVPSARKGPRARGRDRRPIPVAPSKNWRRWKQLPADMRGPNETRCRGNPPPYVQPDVGVVQGQDYLFVSFLVSICLMKQRSCFTHWCTQTL